ncbi:MAG: CBS domain-containing protein, partial [Myxococcota bacterium]
PTTLRDAGSVTGSWLIPASFMRWTASRTVVGIVTESDMLARLVEGQCNLDSSMAEVMFRRVSTVRTDDDAQALLALFAREEAGVVLDRDDRLIGIITKIDLVDHLTHGGPNFQQAG